MPYPATGPFHAGTSPGISAAFLNNVETWLGTALQADGDVSGTSQTFSGTVTAATFSGAIAVTRNGGAATIPAWFTGTGTPSSPPTGSVWIQA